MPSANGLVYIVQLVGFIVFAYVVSTGKAPRLRGIVAFVPLMIGLLGFYEGFTLALREDARQRYGRVVPGLVVEKYRPDGTGHTVATTGREGPHAGRSGYLISEMFAHWIAYGSPAIRIVDYRYPCAAGRQGTCWGRDYVGEALWSQLSVGDHVNVRQSDTETVTARLDENPQRALAAAQAAVAFLFLVAAALISGRLKLPRRRKYLHSEAVVTSVRLVTYGEEKRWKVTFAYFDQRGEVQESIDEVNQATWKPGDACIAVYRPEVPDLATLQPLASH